MLRASSQSNSEVVNLEAVMTGNDAGDIEGGAQLIAMAEAIVGADPESIRVAREQLVQHLSVQAMIEAAGVASNFQRMVRISDSTGIVLGNYEAATTELREELGINRLAR